MPKSAATQKVEGYQTTFTQTLVFRRHPNDEAIEVSEMYVGDRLYEVLGPRTEFETRVVGPDMFVLHIGGTSIIEVFKTIYTDSTWPPFA